LAVNADDYEIAVRLLAALAAGALIGYERSYHGRRRVSARTRSSARHRAC